MTNFIVDKTLAARAGPYSHLAVAGNLVWTAGFGPADPQTGDIPDGIEAQTEATIDRLVTALAGVGAGLGDVVKATVHLADLADFAGLNTVYRRRFSGPYPVRTTVGSALMNILVEIDVVAVLPTGVELRSLPL